MSRVGHPSDGGADLPDSLLQQRSFLYITSDWEIDSYARCLLRRKEQHNRGDFFGRSGALHGCALRTNFQRPRPVHLACESSGRDGIDTNSFIGDLSCCAIGMEQRHVLRYLSATRCAIRLEIRILAFRQPSQRSSPRGLPSAFVWSSSRVRRRRSSCFQIRRCSRNCR